MAKRWGLKTEIVVALIAGAVSLATAGFTAYASNKSNDNASKIAILQQQEDRRQKAEQRQKDSLYYTEPLTRSAYQLQSRLFNILQQNSSEFISYTVTTELSRTLSTIQLLLQHNIYVGRKLFIAPHNS
jgi:hypothetical protein